MPKHSHTRGTMNITGSVTSQDTNYFWGAGTTASGAFADAHVGGSNIGNAYWSGSRGNGFSFDASRTWTGTTSEEGNNAEHNNLQPYLSVFIWKRTA